MPEIGSLVEKVRSKNAGPFWLTIDIFCGGAEAFARVSGELTTARIAALHGCDAAAVKRFDIGALNVVKFSLPRPRVQGRPDDRDMHGAGWAVLVAEMQID